MIAAVALTVAAAALVGAVEYARICLVRARFARAVHAQRRAVPPGEVPPSPGGTVAVTHPTPASRVGDGPVLAGDAHYRKAWGSRNGAEMQLPSQPRRPASVSHIGGRDRSVPAPVSSAGAGTGIGPAGSLHHTSGRPGHHDGPGAA